MTASELPGLTPSKSVIYTRGNAGEEGGGDTPGGRPEERVLINLT